MKYLIHIPIALMLAGCCLFRSEKTDSNTPGAIDSYADKADLIMSRAAAAVDAAQNANANKKPKVVENELNVAAAYLPRPTAADAAYANARAKAEDEEAYDKAVEIGDAHQRQFDELWAAVNADRERTKLALDEKELKYQADRKMFITYVVAGVGGLGVLCGIAMLLFGFNKLNALFSIGVGVAVIAAATVFEAPWFGFVAAAAVLTLIIEIWRRYKSSQSTK